MDLALTATEWMDAFWDEDASLLRHPDDPAHHAVRETAWYGLGLLMRGDAGRGWTALRSVVSQQYQTEGTVFHGTFVRAPEEPFPPDEPRIWIDYDPNWRQFIGCTFAIVADDFGDEGGLRESIDLAVRSETRDVPPSYSNIAMMRAWLDAWAGETVRGEQLAQAIRDRIADVGGLDEFNSPTYYGIDLFALDLWTKRPPTPLFATLGAELDARLMDDIATFWHDGLGNLCGPWLRSYGLDMHRYLAVLGLYIGTFPDVRRPFDHAADLCMGPLVHPRDVRIDPLPRTIDRHVGRLHVTAELHEGAMWGALESGPSGSPQIHPATAHWRNADGTVGWFRMRSRGKLDARATESGLDLDVGPDGATLEYSGDERFRVDRDPVERDEWKLRFGPGALRVEIAR